jgi:hypothetical protein
MTLRAVAWSAARTCTIAVKFTLTAGSMPIVAILVIFWTMSARRCASRKGCRAQEGAGPVRRLIPGPQIHDSWAIPQWERVRFKTANRGGSSCRLR